MFSIFIVIANTVKMDKTSILNQYRDICSDVLNKLATKLNKSFKSFLMECLVAIAGHELQINRTTYEIFANFRNLSFR
ncbi:MAG TPA: hypothetical protein DEP71_04725 [Porphyromonadaceae bacterium]|nr:hypothetical protein [Porphyromonadaceae bacterium]